MLMSKISHVLFSLLLPLIFIFSSSSMLSSCGQSGPLYLPDSPNSPNAHAKKTGYGSSSFLISSASANKTNKTNSNNSGLTHVA